MTAAEHLELSKKYREQAMEHLHKANGGDFNYNYGEFHEYVRLDKLANKHFGIYKGVMTRKLNKALA